MVISDFFHLRLGASVGGDQQHSYSLKVFIVFVPFPQVHLSVGGGGGNRLPQAVEFPQVLLVYIIMLVLTNDDTGLHE